MDILKRDIRETIVSGLFYSDEPELLKQKVKTLLENNGAEKRVTDAPVILSPHGSWEECGDSIAAAFASAKDYKADRILLLGPVHRENKVQKLYLPSKKYFNSPLGLINVDQKICKRLTQSSELFTVNDSPHMEEHALELQLPFIQSLYPEIPVIPVLTGKLKRSLVKKAAAVIRSNILELPGKTLIVLSANLSRYTLKSEAEKEADELLKHLSMPLENSLFELEMSEKISSCGTVLLTLLSDLGIYTSPTAVEVLQRNFTEVKDRRGTMAVYYAGICWPLHGQQK